jgi:hypothetical protein
MATTLELIHDPEHLLDSGVLEELMATAHEDLQKAKVRIQFIFAHPELTEFGKPATPAIKVHGVAARACAKINSYKDRARGLADAEIHLDAFWWDTADPNQRAALIDHELTHFRVMWEDGQKENARLDDHDRPKLKMRAHDYEFGWFNEVAARWKEDSTEVEQAKTMMDQDGQTYWPFTTKSAAA